MIIDVCGIIIGILFCMTSICLLCKVLVFELQSERDPMIIAMSLVLLVIMILFLIVICNLS